MPPARATNRGPSGMLIICVPGGRVTSWVPEDVCTNCWFATAVVLDTTGGAVRCTTCCGTDTTVACITSCCGITSWDTGAPAGCR